MSNRLRDLLVNTDRSVGEHMRRRRWEAVLRTFPQWASLRVLDLGGTPRFWQRAPIRPASVTAINLQPADDGPGVQAMVGDACEADKMLPGEHFDLVFSNSLLEHLGGHAQRRKFADVVARMGDMYWVQTPYRYFPIEPHWLFPGLQFLPVSARASVAQRWPLGFTYGWEAAAVKEEVQSTELVSATEMRSYFPHGTLYWERVGGIPKSMVMVSHGSHFEERR